MQPGQQDEQPEVHPLLAQYDRELHAITEKYRQKYEGQWWFWYSAAKIKPLRPQKSGSISHKTEVYKPEQ